MRHRRKPEETPILPNIIGVGAYSFAPQTQQVTVVCTKLKTGLADHAASIQHLIEGLNQPGLTPQQKQQIHEAISAAQANHQKYTQIVISICGSVR